MPWKIRESNLKTYADPAVRGKFVGENNPMFGKATLCMGCHYFETFGRPLPPGVIWGHNLKHAVEAGVD